MKKELASGVKGRQRIITLNALAKSYWNNKNDSASYFSDSARRLAIQEGDIPGEAEGNRIIGVTKWYQFEKPEIIKPFLVKALELFRSAGNYKGLADTYNNLGSYFNYINDYKTSILYYDSALVVFHQLGDKKGEAAVLNYIGIVYQDMGEFNKAIDYTLKGLVIRKSTNDHMGIVYSFLNVGNIFLAGGQPERAIKYYQEGLDYSDHEDLEPPAMTFNVLGKAYLQLGNLEKAGEYLLPGNNGMINKFPDELLIARLYEARNQPDSAEKYFRKVYNDPWAQGKEDRQAQALAGISRILKTKGNFQEAKMLAIKSYTTTGFLSKLTIAEAAGILADLYEHEGDQKNALSYYKVKHDILDSIANQNYQNKLAYFETSSEIEKVQNRMQTLSVQKELQEKLYKQEKLLKNILIGIAILILSASFFVIRNIYSSRKKILAQNELLDEQNKQVSKALEELKLAQKQLVQVEKMASLGELTAGIAHEIQNPLNFVNNFSDVNAELLDELEQDMQNGKIENAVKLSKDIRENEMKINLHGKKADAIIKSMLQHSRTNSGIKEPTDLNALAEEYLRLSYHGLRAKDKFFRSLLETSFDQNIGEINVNAQDIGRVLLNLYNNAFYAISEKSRQEIDGYEPTISVSTIRHQHSVTITVKDNGNGIPKKVIDKIFQPFFTTKPTGQGTGLGLSLSYDIIKAHGGEIKVESKEGEWTEFVVFILV